jgi:hypothetical protein
MWEQDVSRWLDMGEMSTTYQSLSWVPLTGATTAAFVTLAVVAAGAAEARATTPVRMTPVFMVAEVVELLGPD